MSEPVMINLWVMPHDDADVQFIVNTREEMVNNFDDLIDDRNETVTITMPDGTAHTFDASEVIKSVAPIMYMEDGERYAETWTHVQMPVDLYLNGTDEQRNAFIKEKLS